MIYLPTIKCRTKFILEKNPMFNHNKNVYLVLHTSETLCNNLIGRCLSIGVL